MSAPRPWAEMMQAWRSLFFALTEIVGVEAGEGGRAAFGMPDEGAPLHARVWRWMWSLPPCSEARKAAFTLGAAAMTIDRWRDPTQLPRMEQLTWADITRIGQRAEALLRIAAWHRDDARGEAHARALGREPLIPAHEAVYSAGGYEDKHDGINFTAPADGKRGALMILHHHLSRRQGPKIKAADALLQSFSDLAIASLPDGPWVMTTRDVERFLELIEEAT